MPGPFCPCCDEELRDPRWNHDDHWWDPCPVCIGVILETIEEQRQEDNPDLDSVKWVSNGWEKF